MIPPSNFQNNIKRFIAKRIKQIGRFVQYRGEDADFDMETLINKHRRQGTKIGANAYFVNVYLDPFHPELISIGDNVAVTNSVILTHDDSPITIMSRRRVAPVTIGNNVFIGYRSLILPGVTIGSNCIIGAGSVVTRDIPDNSIAVGVPAKVIKSTPDHIEHLNADPQLLGFRVGSHRISDDEHEILKQQVLEKYRSDAALKQIHIQL